jgi:Domain of unknown function (DUF4145)
MATIGRNWECPYCGHAQVLSGQRVDEFSHQLSVEGEKSERPLYLNGVAIVCANEECRELSLTEALFEEHQDANGRFSAAKRDFWKMLPASTAKPQPDFIPKAIRDDYYEACAIRDLSSKASATIARRCLQAMIRDFCNISKGRLIDEIKELRERVDSGRAPAAVLPDSVDAIDDVRNIGDIGAHMEADTNVITDVDPDEAHVLIELVELLFSEWYIATENRKKRLRHLKEISGDKKQRKNGPIPESFPDTNVEAAPKV